MKRKNIEKIILYMAVFVMAISSWTTGLVDRAVLFAMPRKVNRPQTAVLIRSEPLLAAGIRRFQPVQVRNRIFPIRRVDEKDPRLAVVMRLRHDQVEQLAGAQRLENADRQPRLQRVGHIAVKISREIRRGQIRINEASTG